MALGKAASGTQLVNAARARLANRFGEHFAAKASDPVCLKIDGTDEMGWVQKIVLELEPITVPTFMPLQSEKVKVHAAREKSRREKEIEQLQALFVDRSKSVQELLMRLGVPFETCWLNQTIQTSIEVKALSTVAEDQMVSLIDLPHVLEIDGTVAGQMLFNPPETQLANSGEDNCSGKGIVVAVIDGEVDQKHPGFQRRVVRRRNYTDEDWNNPHRHATAVAGVLGGQLKNYLGAASGCLIHNYKIFNSRGDRPTDIKGYQAIADALTDGAHIVNCSWGAGPVTDGKNREVRACNWAWGRGLTIVKSTGNFTELTTPSDAAGVIAVGACDVLGNYIPSYSGRGKIHDGSHRPHLVAPGGTQSAGIYSFSPSRIGVTPTEIGWGTSYSAACASGLLACLLEAYPQLIFKPEQLRSKLRELCSPLPQVNEIAQGSGWIHPRVPISREPG